VSKRRRQELIESVPAGKRRCYLTHVGLICDRTDLQPLLPQVLIGNEATLLVRDMPALQAACPANVRLIRQKSSWNNGLLCAMIVGLIAAALSAHTDSLQIVLILDAVRLHFAEPVLTACRRHGVWPVFVPARLTWLLQPLDTHGFALFKHRLRMAHQRERVRSPDGTVSFADFLQCVYQAIRTVLQGRRWDTAFDSDGFSQGQLRVAVRVLEELQLHGDLRVPSTRPTREQMMMCFPRRARVPLPALWAAVDNVRIVRVWHGVHALAQGRGAAAAGGRGLGGAAGALAHGRGLGPSRTRSGLIYKAG
jgi:hypothetical protein